MSAGLVNFYTQSWLSTELEIFFKAILEKGIDLIFLCVWATQNVGWIGKFLHEFTRFCSLFLPQYSCFSSLPCFLSVLQLIRLLVIQTKTTWLTAPSCIPSLLYPAILCISVDAYGDCACFFVSGNKVPPPRLAPLPPPPKKKPTHKHPPPPPGLLKDRRVHTGCTV